MFKNMLEFPHRGNAIALSVGRLDKSDTCMHTVCVYIYLLRGDLTTNGLDAEVCCVHWVGGPCLIALQAHVHPIHAIYVYD